MSIRLVIRPFEARDRQEVVKLWQDCGLVVPWNDPDRDIDRKMAVQPELFLIGEIAGVVVATTMAGYDGHRGWLYSVAVAPEHRRRGIGRQIVHAAVERLWAMGCRKVNLQVRTTNTQVLDFYERLGFRSDNVIGLGLRLNDTPPIESVE